MSRTPSGRGKPTARVSRTPRRRGVGGTAAAMPAMTPRRLMLEAEAARREAYAPYSRFAVGAALLTRDGRVIRGANVENASYGLSMCAERAAVFKAVSEGARDFVAVAVAVAPGSAASPCGACRQVLHEFAPTMRVHWRDARGRIITRTAEQLLALPFRSAELTPRAGAKGRTRR